MKDSLSIQKVTKEVFIINTSSILACLNCNKARTQKLKGLTFYEMCNLYRTNEIYLVSKNNIVIGLLFYSFSLSNIHLFESPSLCAASKLTLVDTLFFIKLKNNHISYSYSYYNNPIYNYIYCDYLFPDFNPKIQKIKNNLNKYSNIIWI